MKDFKETRAVERQMPNKSHVEGVVLGTLISFPNDIEQVAEVLRPDDFYVLRHKILYEVMLAYYRKHGHGADFLVLSDLLEGNEDLESSDLVALMELKSEMWSTNLEEDVRLILGASFQRLAIAASQKLAVIGYSITDPEKSRQSIEKLLYDLTMEHMPTSDFRDIGDFADESIRDIEIANKNRGKLLGITTGFTDLDLMTSGLQRSDLILLAGRPSMGKTSLGMNIAYNAARKGHAVAVFSLEMGGKQLAMRLLARHSGIPSNKLRAGWIDDEDWEKVVVAGDHLSDLCLSVDETVGSPISSMRGKLRRLKARIKRPLDLVVVDYLGLMQSEDESPAHRENRNQEISQISRGLKGLAREFDVPVLALAQLSRAVESRQSKIPQLSDLRDSGSLEQDADIVAFIYRDDYYAGFDASGKSLSKNPGTGTVIIAKHRNGPVGEVMLKFDGALTCFRNLETTTEEG